MSEITPTLGQTTEYPCCYAPELLVSISRQEGRNELASQVSFKGEDIWTAYELSWLDSRGKPCVAIGEFSVSCDSVSIIESKSFKLYLNSLNQQQFESQQELIAILKKDLSNGFGGVVEVSLFSLDEYQQQGIRAFSGTCIDSLEIDCDTYTPKDAFLEFEGSSTVTETLYSHLLKTNCPVTGQPDWASIAITYTGKKLNQEGLLKYLVSFRQHQGFHENCVEKIYMDILSLVQPSALSVYARYTRRGGLDINPYRSSHLSRSEVSSPEVSRPEWLRVSRQ